MKKKKAGQKMALKPVPKWADVPEGWVCPECAATKADFEMIEI